MIYTIYNPTTGEISTHLTTDNLQVAERNLAGKTYIEGKIDGNTHYIANGQPVAKTTKPGENYEFNYDTKTWQLNIEKEIIIARNLRNNLLSEVDRVNPVRYSTLTAEQQAELAAYRQALLDVPQQMGFPTDISWPAKPAWL
jgi:hypothetical protein